MSKTVIKNIKVFRFEKEGAVKASVSWSLNGIISFMNWRIIQGSKGLFVTGPQQKVKDKYVSYVTITSKELLAEVSAALIEAYEAETPKPQVAKNNNSNDESDDGEWPF